ncbi:MAG: dockerin type I repeat-containing protein [Ruminococcus sp.]|uniref:dockerin type I repeat-containing protein n=1 Tax=Ruminococcus sp. TaxID=41978 RepID=UPI0025F14EDF|nr:dockerin type I repeat-containing protein [Ruminococcus sp.]MCR5542344.1 dockerin type I repeat-containing protein [Ruminococcus sp.]
MNKLIRSAVAMLCASTMAMSFISVSADKVSNTRGDVNGDGRVNITDITKIAAHIKGKRILKGDSLTNADVNFDGKIDVTDITIIAAFIKGKRLLPTDPNSADETFKGYDAYIIFADGDMNWGNWNGQGHPRAASYGVDADVTGDGVYTVSITRDSITSVDDMGKNSSLIYTNEGANGSYLPWAYGCSIMCVDITGLLDGTLAADGSELGGFLEEGSNPNINKRVKGKFRGDELKVEVKSIKVDDEELWFAPGKIRYGNLDEEDNCYRIEIANLLSGDADDAAINVNNFFFSDELSVTFSISGIGTSKK